ECLTGSAELRDLDGTLLRGFDAGRHRLTVALALYGPVVINARFFRRRLFDRLGGFCPQFRIAGDRDFLLRCAVAGVPAAETDALV
ncbi:hypothetical protein, partial [Klebsiella pneumoniae]|uniref:hypothetical protein n=1 Tax=Klebsiella pneumoniae TaxID=573 RepID=UPI003EE04478